MSIYNKILFPLIYLIFLEEQNKLGILLVSISVLFVFCQSFKMIPDIYELWYCPPVQGQDHLCKTTPSIRACVSLSHLLVCVKSAVNWIIYLLAGEKFRRVWCETYLPIKYRPKFLKRQGTKSTKYTNQVRRGAKTTTGEGKIDYKVAGTELTLCIILVNVSLFLEMNNIVVLFYFFNFLRCC